MPDDARHADDGEAWLDVDYAIDAIAGLIREKPEVDHLFIDPIAECGHVGRGHVRNMLRGSDVPVKEWFELAVWMGSDTAAVLFTCRSLQFDGVTEVDVDVARSLAAYRARPGTSLGTRLRNEQGEL